MDASIAGQGGGGFLGRHRQVEKLFSNRRFQKHPFQSSVDAEPKAAKRSCPFMAEASDYRVFRGSHLRRIGHKMIFDPEEHAEELTAPFRTVPDSMFTLFRVMSGAQSDAEARPAFDQQSLALIESETLYMSPISTRISAFWVFVLYGPKFGRRVSPRPKVASEAAILLEHVFFYSERGALAA